MLRFTWAWLSSILLHALFIFILFFFCKNWQDEFLQPGNFDFFYLQSVPQKFSTANNVKSANTTAKQKIRRGEADRSALGIVGTSGTDPVASPIDYGRGNLAPTGSTGDSKLATDNSVFGNNETKKILLQIRKKIEKAKHYPVMAKNKGIEGKTQIRFQLNSDGSVKNLFLSRSSGFDILDESALQAVKLAAPYPYFPGPIQFELKFQLLAM